MRGLGFGAYNFHAYLNFDKLRVGETCVLFDFDLDAVSELRLVSNHHLPFKMDSEEACELLGAGRLPDEKQRRQMHVGGMPGAMVRRSCNMALMRALTPIEVDEFHRMDVFNF